MAVDVSAIPLLFGAHIEHRHRSRRLLDLAVGLMDRERGERCQFIATRLPSVHAAFEVALHVIEADS